MEIKAVSIVGLGALGVLFGSLLSERLPQGALRIVADRSRIEKYRRDGVYCNDKRCDFNYVPADENVSPCDLLLIAVKFGDLPAAIDASKKQLGPDTVILSLLNGISSEGLIGEAFGAEKILPCVAQGMDAVKVGNSLCYHHTGMICFGSAVANEKNDKAEAVGRFFKEMNIPYELVADMPKRLWGKFMLNVGVNQTAAVFECDYGGLQKSGPIRDTMVAAMEEALALSAKEHIGLTHADLDYWLHILDGLNTRGKPSMRQDLEAKRHSEVGLFAGTVLEMGRKHNMAFPVNQMLYDKIMATESAF